MAVPEDWYNRQGLRKCSLSPARSAADFTVGLDKHRLSVRSLLAPPEGKELVSSQCF